MRFDFASNMLLSVLAASAVASYTDSLARIALQLSSNAYCDPTAYLTHTYENAAKGFVATKVLKQDLYGVAGYIGYLPSDKAIYVTFRGSVNIANWITNLDTTKDAYEAFPECNC